MRLATQNHIKGIRKGWVLFFASDLGIALVTEPSLFYISVSVQSGGGDLRRLLPQKPDGISVCIEENIFILLSCCSFLRTGYRSGAARDFCGLFFPAFRILVLYFFSSFWNQDVPRFPDKFLKYNSSLNTCGKGRPLYFYGRTKDVRLNQLNLRVEKKMRELEERYEDGKGKKKTKEVA